jgi:hypothetical protein
MIYSKSVSYVILLMTLKTYTVILWICLNETNGKVDLQIQICAIMAGGPSIIYTPI